MTTDNGHWTIAAADPKARHSRRYRGNSLVLETNIDTADGAVTLIDFMPLRTDGASHLVRIVRGRVGQVEMLTQLVLRFDYGSIIPWVRRLGDGGLKAVAGPDMVVLRTRVDLKPDGYKHHAKFAVKAGEVVTFVLGYGSSFGPMPDAIDPLAALEATADGWEKWASQCHEVGRYSDAVLRSLITLKALTYRPTGGIVAAPTTSLPEKLGKSRNWDYRYCWLRDATFTLLALLNSSFHREAADWRAWLRRAVAGNPAQVQIMYGLAGERRLDECELSWLRGYEGAHAARIGNAAAKQLQVDIFGELMDAL